MNVATATMEHNMMVRLCCGQRHSGTVCPDGMVMCCICFERVSQQQLNTIDGKKEDVCKRCATYSDGTTSLGNTWRDGG